MNQQKPKRTRKKLTLTKETLRKLEAPQLSHVQGGGITCDDTGSSKQEEALD